MGARRSSALRPALVMAVAGGLLAGCVTPARPAVERLPGATLEVLASWSDVEQQRFERVLEAFERDTGAVVRYTSAQRKVADVLGQRMASHRPPDVAFLPQPGMLRQYAAARLLVPLDAATTKLVTANYAPVWRQLASYENRLYGVWFKAANKSLIWYNVAAFERVGVAPPADIAGLLDLEASFARVHLPAFAVGGADAWTLTDLFENLYIRLESPKMYDALAAHTIPWTDPSVVRTLQLFAKLLAPAFVSDGLAGATRTTFEQSIATAFAVSPGAAMIAEGDFVGGIVTGSTHARLGIDVDVFPFPAVGSSPPVVVGGGDVAVLLRPSRAGAALLRYLASPEAAALWAAQGGFVSPNLNLDLSIYPDLISRSIARSLLEAGDGFRFDLSDLQPSAFGGSSDQGMIKELQRFLVTRDPENTAARLEAAARALIPTSSR
jgi:ABC-type glycerol-3-phosphate transport system substrate-binding protein